MEIFLMERGAYQAAPHPGQEVQGRLGIGSPLRRDRAAWTVVSGVVALVCCSRSSLGRDLDCAIHTCSQLRSLHALFS
jgi:hypothetical protein